MCGGAFVKEIDARRTATRRAGDIADSFANGLPPWGTASPPSRRPLFSKRRRDGRNYRRPGKLCGKSPDLADAAAASPAIRGLILSRQGLTK